MVEWIFHPPLSSHQSGVWERQIRTIRKVLVAVINSMARMTDDILHTFLCITEGNINSRPITKVSSDVMDETALSPNHLLLMRGNDVLPWGDFHDSDVYRKRWRQVQHMADRFWTRWLKEYLPELKRQQKWTNLLPNLSVGGLVLVFDEQAPRGAWPMGVVVDRNICRWEDGPDVGPLTLLLGKPSMTGTGKL